MSFLKKKLKCMKNIVSEQFRHGIFTNMMVDNKKRVFITIYHI